MKTEDAEEYTDALGQIVGGSWRQIALGDRLGVPEALGLTTREWVEERLGGYARLAIPDRREAVAELAADGMTQREIADVLGVAKGTVGRDLAPNGADDDAEPAPLASDLIDLAPNGADDDGMAVHYSSASAEWATPEAFFQVLHAEFGFDLDVCATAENAKCPRYYDEAADGLAQEWSGVCWMNPPYGREIGAWMAKAHAAAKNGATVVCLVPARTDTEWWWEHARRGEIRFLRGRLRFNDADPAPFPSAVVVFGAGRARVVWWTP